jgi:RNase P subunit RPR2
MITILKKGTKKTINCYNCGALLSYEGEDIEVKTVSTRFSSSSISYITCPQCQEQIRLESTK